jgi:hypothetical protein
MEKVDGWLSEAGRDRSSFGIEARLDAGQGTADDWGKTVADWTRLGASHMSVGTGGAGLKTVDEHIPRLREAREVLTQ